MRLLNTQEVADRLDIHRNTVRNWCSKGILIPHTSNCHRFDAEQVDILANEIASKRTPIENGELWLPVVDYETRYHVSDFGNVFSVKASRNLHPSLSHGYLVVNLYNGTRKPLLKPVHIIVLEAFVGPRPDGLEGLHSNDIRLDNHSANLYWGTRSDNEFDKVRNGRHHQASKTQCPQGHRYTLKNTDVRIYGKYTYRYCKQCQIDSRHRRAV